MINVVCKGCSARLKAKPKLYGKVVKCPKCHAPISIPSPSTNEEPVGKSSVTRQNDPVAVAKDDAATTQQAVRKPSQAKQEAPSVPPESKSIDAGEPMKKNNLTRKVALALGTLLLLATLGLSLMWLLPSVAESGGSKPAAEIDADTVVNTADTVANIDLGPEPEPPPKFEFYFGKPNTLTGYEVQIKVDAEGKEPVSARGDFVFVNRKTDSEMESSVKRTGFGRKPRLPSWYGFTGLGIPGKRILVPYELAEKASTIEIAFLGRTYQAKIVEEYADDGFSVLSYEGPDFAPLRISRANELDGTVDLLQFNSIGKVEALVEVQVASNRKETTLNNMYRPWQSGVLYKQWGTVAGIGYETRRNRNRVLAMSEIANHFGPEVFSYRPIESPSIEKIVNEAKKNLVEVTVTRPATNANELSFSYRHRFDLPQGGNLIKFPRHAFYAKSTNERIIVEKLGKFDDSMSPKGLTWLPPGIVSIPGAVLFEIDPDNDAWKEADKLFAVPRGRSGLEFIRDRDIKKKHEKGELVYRLHAENRLLKREGSLVNVERTFSVTPHEENPDAKQAKSFLCNATQLIEFDLQRGVVVRSTVSGGVSEEDFKASYKIEIDLLDPAKAQAAFSKMAQSRQAAGSPPTLKLDPSEVKELAEKLKNPTTGGFQKALKKLNQIAPEPNEEISHAIAVDFAKYFNNRSGSKPACRNWVLGKHVPVVLKSYIEQQKKEKRINYSAILDLLMMHPRLDDSQISYVKTVLQASIEKHTSAACGVLCSKYPELLEPVCLEYLNSGTRMTQNGVEVARLLGELGSSHCIEPLEDFLKHSGSRISAKDAIPVFEAITKLKQEKNN